MKFNNMNDVFNYLDTINDVNDLRYYDCKMHSFINEDTYKKILDKVLALDEKPKRVIDIGSNLNQYAYLFVNEGIDYVGIDLWNACRYMKPLETENIQFIGGRYEDISEFFKDDVIISNLCVGYLVNEDDVKAKHFINGSDLHERRK